MSDLTPGFIVAHSHRLEELTDLVVRLTRNYPLHPLDTETVLVQSNGIAQWLKINLAQQVGIAAMLQVTLPARLQWQLYRAVLGDDLPTTSPFDKNRLVWRLMRLLPSQLADPRFEPLRDYVAEDADQRKLYQLAERLADLYDQYQMYRPHWLAAWVAGDDQPANGDTLWQPALWRVVMADVGAARWNNRATLHQAFIDKAQQLTPATRPEGVPPRIIVFGISSLPQQILQLLDALKGCCQVVLCVHNPSQYHWADIVEHRRAFKPGMASDITLEQLHVSGNPLLAAWGKQGRDYIRMLDVFDETRLKSEHFNELNFDLFESQQPSNLLQQLHDDILHLRDLAETQQQWPRYQPSDDSLVVKCAHSAQREVEILHDHLLATFAADNSLTPRDVMVMVPNIDDYAAHIEAVFGRIDRDDPRYIPYTLADQGQRHRNPLLIALEQLLTVHQARMSMSDVLDLLQVPALQQRFGLAPEQLPLLQQWIHAAGIRWGLHGEHRQQLGIAANHGLHTWKFGIERMLLGYAMGQPDSDDVLWQGIVPFAEVGGLEAASVGALGQLLTAIQEYYQALQQPRNATDWLQLLQQFMADFFTASDDADLLLLANLQQQLQHWWQCCHDADYQQLVPLTVVQESWLGQIDQPQLQQRFLAGSVNFATLMPMRAIPFKLVCLLGMNDGDYPRSQKPYDFDLMADDYQPGDRSRRDDDRYLFLEALLSARRQFYVSWQGRSIRDNSKRPPSVLLSQLLEHLSLGWGADELVQEHRMQPFHADYFQRADANHQQLFSYAHEWQRAHQQWQVDGLHALPDWIPETPLSLKQLADFLREPARLLFNQRFSVYFQQQQQRAEDDEALVLNGLDLWQLKAPLLEQLVALLTDSTEPRDWQAAANGRLLNLQRQGQLPTGAAGALIADQLLTDLATVQQHLQRWLEAYPQPLAVQPVSHSMHVPAVDQQLRIQDNLAGVRTNAAGDWLLLRVSASKISNDDDLKATKLAKVLLEWLQHVVLNCTQPARTVIIGMPGCIEFPVMAKAVAQRYIECLLSWVLKGYQQPLAVDFETVYQAWQSNYAKLDEFLASEQPNSDGGGKIAEFYADGGFHRPPHRLNVPYLARFYPDYRDMVVRADYQELAQQLYLPLVRAAYRTLAIRQAEQAVTEDA